MKKFIPYEGIMLAQTPNGYIVKKNKIVSITNIDPQFRDTLLSLDPIKVSEGQGKIGLLYVFSDLTESCDGDPIKNIVKIVNQNTDLYKREGISLTELREELYGLGYAVRGPIYRDYKGEIGRELEILFDLAWHGLINSKIELKGKKYSFDDDCSIKNHLKAIAERKSRTKLMQHQ